MTTSLHYLMAGMGQGSTAQQVVTYTTSAAEATVPVLVGPSVAALLGITTAAAIPIVGAAIAGISIAIEAILNSGCGQTCIETSQWANQAEVYLQKNIAQYFAIPAPRPLSVQQLAMANFQAIWNQLDKLCSQPGTGNAGVRCISDRQDGACKWRATTPQYPGGPAPGACWNWWNGYYYPIANDPNVSSATSSISTLASATGNVVSAVTSSGGGISPVLILAGGALALWMVMS